MEDNNNSIISNGASRGMKRRRDEVTATGDGNNASSNAASRVPPTWRVENCDPDTTEPQCIEKEIQRLKALKTFGLLNKPINEPCFERFTQLAARICGTSYALLTLVDLGRTFVLAQTGFDATSSQLVQRRELPRQSSFCAHAILLTQSQTLLQVHDTTTDARWAQTPLVVEYGIRFAGAVPLRTTSHKGGQAIGCLSVMHTQPRVPNGLSTDQQTSLVDLAHAVMDLMLAQRDAAAAATTPAIPLDALQLSETLSHTLQHWQDNANQTQQPAQLQSACATAQQLVSVLTQASSSSRSTAAASAQNAAVHGDDEKTKRDSVDSSKEKGAPSASAHQPAATSSGQKERPTSQHASRSSSTESLEKVGEQTTVLVSNLIQNLLSAMEVFPKMANLAFVVDPAVPNDIVCNDLKVFRSAIALLTSACERTERGYVRFRVYPKVTAAATSDAADEGQGHRMLVFECEDTGHDVALEQYHELFMIPGKAEMEETTTRTTDEECISVDPATGQVHRKAFCQISPKMPIASTVAVYPVARYVQSMGGDYGYLPRMARGDSQTDNVPDTGSVFWFSIPLREATSSLDRAIGIALGLDEDREVVGSETTDLRLSQSRRLF